jgi:Helix-turn-helix domain
MVFLSKLTPEQWAEAARMRAAGTSYAAIAHQFGVAPTTIQNHALCHGWPGCGPPRPASLRKRSFVGATAGMRRKLVRRLYSAIDTKLSLMERRMQQQLDTLDADPGAPAIPAVDAEREARAIGTLIRNLDKVTEFAAELDRTASGGPGTTDAAALASEADAFRREIAQRLAKLIPAR